MMPLDKLANLLLEQPADDSKCLMVVLLFAKLISTEESDKLVKINLMKVYAHCMESAKSSLGIHALKTDICIEALAYLSLKN